MSDRPTHLILVIHPDQGGVDLWSAHYTQAEATVMFDRLTVLLGATRSTVQMIQVPETDGMVEATGHMAVTSPARRPPASPQPIAGPASEPQPFRRQSRADFEEETRQMMEDAKAGLARDADVPLAEGGAFS